MEYSPKRKKRHSDQPMFLNLAQKRETLSNLSNILMQKSNIRR